MALAGALLAGCFSDQVAQGSAQLTVASSASIVSSMFTDTRCGFASAEVQRAGVFTGPIGGQGEAVYTISEPCQLDFGLGQEVLSACASGGSPTYAGGRVSVTGSMHIKGFLTGSSAFPIIPTGRDAVEITFEAGFNNFRSWTGGNDAILSILRGKLAGIVRPQLSIDATTGACSVPSSNVEFRRLKYHGADAVLDASGHRFELELSASDLEAQAGTNGTRSNFLSGALVVNGDVFAIPTHGEPVLDPAAQGAAPGGSCNPTVLVAETDDDCSVEHVVGLGAARLTIQTAGAIAAMAASNNSCGFANPVVQLTPKDVDGDPGELGSMTWEIAGCNVGRLLAPEKPDCVGGQLWLGGNAVTNASLTARGLRTQILVAQALSPDSPDSVRLELSDVRLGGFVAYQLAAGATSPIGTLTIHSGALSGIVRPVMGEEANHSGVFDIPTPVASFEHVALRGASATLWTTGLSIDLAIQDSDLDALNGHHGGRTNRLSGSMTINGKHVAIAPSGLDPGFDQQRFDDSYACTPNLRSVIRD